MAKSGKIVYYGTGRRKSSIARVRLVEGSGKITVNGQEKNAIYRLEKDDLVTVTVPDEPENEKLIPDDFPLNVLFEDDHY